MANLVQDNVSPGISLTTASTRNNNRYAASACEKSPLRYGMNVTNDTHPSAVTATMRKSFTLHDAMPEARCWTYALADGWIVRAGKSDDDNELLSLHCAHPDDWWFHVHAMPGSHVVLSHEDKDKTPAADCLRTAAAIAAWHSKARSGGKCSVSYTQVRNVSKAPGTKPGTVCIRKEKTLRVKPALPTASNGG
jgi:hypothetical protein